MAKIYCVQMPVYGTTTVYVKAESIEEALAISNETYEGHSLNVCWSCAKDIDEPLIGEAEGKDSVFEVDMSDSIAVKRAREWIDEH